MPHLSYRNSITSHTALICCTALYLAASVLPRTAHASEVDHFDLSPEQLFDATVVSASRTSEKLRNAPAAIYVLTQEDISRSGATSIPEVLRLVPGVQVSRINAQSWAISVRGFNNDLSNKLLVLIDGREVYDHLFSGVYWDLQDTALEDIDRIEVIRGPGAALWGANAVNGVINVITKASGKTQGRMLSVIAGNQDRAITTGRYGGKLGKNGHYRIYGKYLNRDTEKALPGHTTMDNWTAGRGGFRADWTSEKQDNFTVLGDVYRSDLEQYRPVPQLIAPFTDLREEELTARGTNLLGKWTRNLSDDSSLSLQTYIDYSFHDLKLLQDERTVLDLDAQYEFPDRGRHKLMLGARSRTILQNLTGSPQTNFEENDRNDQLFSGFIQDKITLLADEWYLTLGSKFEHNDFTGFELQPNARLQWHPDDNQMVWSSVSRAVRTPSPLESTSTLALATLSNPSVPLPISVTIFPNSNMASEELTAYELGYRKQISPSLQLDISTFYNDYDKLATNTLQPFSVINNGIDPAYVLFPVNITNDTTATTYGVETVLNWLALDSLNISISYSLLKMDLDGPAGTAAIDPESPEGKSPQQQFNLRTLWNITDDTSFDTTLYYVDSLPWFHVKDFWRLDMRYGWRISDQLELSLAAQNILDEAHQEFGEANSYNTTEIGRSLYGKVTWKF